MKHRIVDTTKLEEDEDTRIILRETASGLKTLEMDLNSLRKLGLPITVEGARRRGTIRVSVENGPIWDQGGRINPQEY